MRPAVALLLACLALAACGGTDRKTVIVNPPPDSTTVVDRDGNARELVDHIGRQDRLLRLRVDEAEREPAGIRGG